LAFHDLSNEDDIHYNALGLPYRKINNAAYPPFFSANETTHLQKQWTARPDDVFLVFPIETPHCPNSNAFEKFAVALVEQMDVNSVDLEHPRWIDAAASRRGEAFLDYLDSQKKRRVLTTKVPPWRFPSNSFHYCPCDTSAGPVDANGMPLIAIFADDPRSMVMRELATALELSTKWTNKRRGQQDTPELIELINAMVRNDCMDTSGLSVLGNSLRTVAAWARAEAMFPDNVRIFFMEDFVLQPEVAMRGLAKFLQVPEKTTATEMVIHESARLAGCAYSPNEFGKFSLPQSSVLPQQPWVKILSSSIESLVVEFETQLSTAPEEVQTGWDKLLQIYWEQSPSMRLASYARVALHHERWDPPGWWVAHNARVCRPCLYFPRGKCHDDHCGYCHGPDHPKPKRPAKNKRASARRRFDRTPSPSPERTMHVQEPLKQPMLQMVQPQVKMIQAPVQSFTPVLVWTPAIATVYAD
jgi:hypothetical protein